ncbi:MAG: RNA recognition motif domain-containing protein [Elusimicrobiota bacterium]
MVTSKLFVGGLPATTTHADLVKLFGTAGSVFGVKIVMDRQTNRSKGFAFVEMATPADAQAALKKLDGFKLVDRRIFITEARPQEKRAVASPSPSSGKAAGKAGFKPAFKQGAPAFGEPGFIDRRSGKDRRAQPPAETPRRKPETPSFIKKKTAEPGGFGPGFTRDRWKKPGRTRRA